MIEPTLTWMKAVKNAINKLYKQYNLNKGMLLTEGDLECHLFNKLMQEKDLKGYHTSQNDTKHNKHKGEDFKTSFIHSQVTWFKSEQKSGFEVDLTIGDPKYLEVINLDLFEEYTHKGFAYDGPCIAIELKFIREHSKPERYDEDFFKLRDKLIPAKLENIIAEKYKVSNENNIAFITLVGCKNKELFDKVKTFHIKHLSDTTKPCHANMFVCIFYYDEIIWLK